MASTSQIPKIQVVNHVLTLPIAGLPPFLLQLVLLEAQTMVWLGQAGASARLASDWSIAMPTSHSTTLSRAGSNDTSLSMSKRLSRRFGQPVFLSLDLPLLDAGSSGISTEQSGSVLVQLERLLVQKMQETLAGPPKAAQAGGTLSGEMVGR